MGWIDPVIGIGGVLMGAMATDQLSRRRDRRLRDERTREAERLELLSEGQWRAMVLERIGRLEGVTIGNASAMHQHGIEHEYGTPFNLIRRRKENR